MGRCACFVYSGSSCNTYSVRQSCWQRGRFFYPVACFGSFGVACRPDRRATLFKNPAEALISRGLEGVPMRKRSLVALVFLLLATVPRAAEKRFITEKDLLKF